MPYPSALHPSSHLPNPFSLISRPSPLVQIPIFSPLLPQTSPPPSHPPSSRTLFIHPSNTPHFSPHTSYPPSHFRPIHSLLITHYSSLIPPPSSLMPHTSFPILHTHPLYLMTLPLIPALSLSYLPSLLLPHPSSFIRHPFSLICIPSTIILLSHTSSPHLHLISSLTHPPSFLLSQPSSPLSLIPHLSHLLSSLKPHLLPYTSCTPSYSTSSFLPNH